MKVGNEGVTALVPGAECVSPNSYVKALIPSVAVLGAEAWGRGLGPVGGAP